MMTDIVILSLCQWWYSVWYHWSFDCYCFWSIWNYFDTVLLIVFICPEGVACMPLKCGHGLWLTACASVCLSIVSLCILLLMSSVLLFVTGTCCSFYILLIHYILYSIHSSTFRLMVFSDGNCYDYTFYVIRYLQIWLMVSREYRCYGMFDDVMIYLKYSNGNLSMENLWLISSVILHSVSLFSVHYFDIDDDILHWPDDTIVRLKYILPISFWLVVFSIYLFSIFFNASDDWYLTAAFLWSLPFLYTASWACVASTSEYKS
jgi:hypothetical protein